MTSRDKTKLVMIYTDGGAVPNPGVGGWAAVLLYGNHRKEISGAVRHTTNNRMEMTAAIQGLKSLKGPCRVILFTDSEYLKKGITQWLPVWKRKNWKRKGGALKNVDLWKEIDMISQEHEIEWRWLRGHAGFRENERCDQLVSHAIKAFKRKRRK